jgi:hypothetical protein
VNIVSRTGGNEFHGSGYYFFRDHNMAAYPGLRRNPLNPDPFFARRNPGVWVGGPIKKDRLFFFTNYEYTNQTQAFTVQPDLPSVAALAGTFGSPYRGHLFSTRFDWRITEKHSLFARYSHDQNKGVGPSGGSPLPSNWLQNRNFSDQSVLGITSSFSSTIVNDFRGTYAYWQNRNLFADSSTCPAPCLGLGGPQVTLVGSSNFAVGNTSNATQGRDLRRFNFTDQLTWQKGTHRMRFGTEFEHAPGTGFWGFCDPACTVAFSPEAVRATAGALTPVLFPNLPTQIRTSADLLNLPFAGGVVGIGDPSQPPPYNIDKAKLNRRVRVFAQDTWRIKPSFTLNYGLAWQFESTLVNRDLDKPAYLRPVYGNDLSPTRNNYKNFSPSLGFAWNVGKNNKTVIRGGSGIYFDTEELFRRLQERAFIGPRGNGRVQFPHTGFRNIFPGIINLATGQPVAVGANLPANTLTTLTLGQFNEIVRQQGPAVTASLAPTNLNDLSVRNIQINKAAAQLYPLDFPVMRSYHMSIGVQRELAKDFVLNVDYVRRVFTHVRLPSEIDRNRFNRFINGVQTPVIPRCANAAQQNDINAQCSSGPISFWTPEGRNVYNGLLVKLDKRFSKRYLFTASYALTAQSAINDIVNFDNFFAAWGPTGPRHILNVSAIVDLPWGFQFGFISASSSRGPVMPVVTQVDLDGDGITTTPIPGVDYNCFNRGCGKSQLATAVQNWNSNLAGRRDARGQTIPSLTLPQNYQFGDSFSSQDIRLTKNFTWRERYKLNIFAEMFNVLNVANLSQFNFQLNSPTFGQPQQRVVQTFGSGGPRALQVGGRFTF